MYMFTAMTTWLIGPLKKKSQYIYINYKTEMLKTQELHFVKLQKFSQETYSGYLVLADICETFCPAQALCYHCSDL